MAIVMSERVTDVGKFKLISWSGDVKASQYGGLMQIVCT